MKYWDSSALVPLLVKQARTVQMQALYRKNPEVLTWWGTRVECASAIARLEREGLLQPLSVRTALRRLDDVAVRWYEVEPADAVRERSQRLLRVHPLRAADALQLAAALVALPGGDLICLDDRLSTAAEKEGLRVLPDEA